MTIVRHVFGNKKASSFRIINWPASALALNRALPGQDQRPEKSFLDGIPLITREDQTWLVFYATNVLGIQLGFLFAPNTSLGILDANKGMNLGILSSS